MEHLAEVQQIVYEILRTQIESGIYRYNESLLTMEEAGGQFNVSIDTIRSAYSRLKQEGYISLSKKSGAKVLVQRSEQEYAMNIQTYFGLRKDSLIDLGKSLRPLFSRAQWLGLKHVSADILEQMEMLSNISRDAHIPYAVWKSLEKRYAALGNKLLTRLAWQVYMFLHAPFFSIKGNITYLTDGETYEQDTFSLCRQQDWPTLKESINRFQDNLSAALDRFYGEKAIMQPAGQSIAFCWNSYRKPSQLRYSLAVDLLVCICDGVYPEGSFLPTSKQLSMEKEVSVSTVRRAVSLLGSIGAVKSARTIGARVLPLDQSTEHCDFTQPALQRRLLDMAYSLQMFALSCRNVSRITLSLNAHSKEPLLQAFYMIKNRQRYDRLEYTTLDLLAKLAPYQAIRTVYSELLRQFFWSHALRKMAGGPEAMEAAYGPYVEEFISCLESGDITRFSAKLESLVTCELRQTVKNLQKLGIPGVVDILIPDIHE